LKTNADQKQTPVALSEESIPQQEKTVAVATIFFLAHPVVKDDDEQGISDEFDRLQVQ